MNEDLYWWISTPDIGLFSTKFEGAIHGVSCLSVYGKYIVKKFFWYFLTLVIAVTLNFLLPRMIEGIRSA